MDKNNTYGVMQAYGNWRDRYQGTINDFPSGLSGWVGIPSTVSIPIDKSQPIGLGLKYDTGKPPISLVDSEFIEGMADVLGFGANKYATDNWRDGIAFRRLLDGIYRHLGAINKNEDIDPESGRPHAYHAACGIMFLSWMMKHRPDLDDRWKGSPK